MRKMDFEIKVDNNGAPRLPKGWTYLIHGSNKSRWNKVLLNNDEFIVKNMIESGMSFKEKSEVEKYYEETGTTVADRHSLKWGKKGENFEIRCLIYNDVTRKSDENNIKEKLSPDEINEIAKIHYKNSIPGAACIPNGTKLVKLTENAFDEITKKNKEIFWYVPEKYLQHYLEDSKSLENKFQEVENEYKINDKKITIKEEKQDDCNRTKKYINDVEVENNTEYKNGSYDNSSRVILKDNQEYFGKNIKLSDEFCNYTLCSKTYNSQTGKYVDKYVSPIIDERGNIFGQREFTEVDYSNGYRTIFTKEELENSNGKYKIEEDVEVLGGELVSKENVMTIDNKRSGSKEVIKYSKDKNENEVYIYFEDGRIGQKINKTSRGTTIDIYKEGQIYETAEYDENGKAIIPLGSLDKISEDYVINCFEIAIPENEVLIHVYPEELEILHKELVEEDKRIDKKDDFRSELKNQVSNDVAKTPIEAKEDKSRERIDFDDIRKRLNDMVNDGFDIDSYTDFETEEEEVKKEEIHKVEKTDDNHIM